MSSTPALEKRVSLRTAKRLLAQQQAAVAALASSPRSQHALVRQAESLAKEELRQHHEHQHATQQQQHGYHSYAPSSYSGLDGEAVSALSSLFQPAASAPAISVSPPPPMPVVPFMPYTPTAQHQLYANQMPSVGMFPPQQPSAGALAAAAAASTTPYLTSPATSYRGVSGGGGGGGGGSFLLPASAALASGHSHSSAPVASVASAPYTTTRLPILHPWFFERRHDPSRPAHEPPGPSCFADLTSGPEAFYSSLRLALKANLSQAPVCLPVPDLTATPVFVNTKQARRFAHRSTARKRKQLLLLAGPRGLGAPKHLSRQLHAARRVRGKGGRFLTKEEREAMQTVGTTVKEESEED